jgi:signal transduction histidine kinase
VLAAFIEARYRAAEMTRLYVSATAASQAKSSFLSMAAHELLTPLTVFTGYLSLLSGGSLGKPPDAWVTPVNILMQKTREMERIVSDLQSASSLEVVDSNLGREVIDLRKVVNEAVERAHPRAELLRAEVVVNVPNDPVPVEADEDHLGRVMDDLINNAFTYTIRTPRLVIGLSTRSRKAIVEVEDNGVGIKAADRERVFDRLYRVVDPQVVVPGIGLGLYICRQLAQSYGGSLAVESSKPGKGSVFALALPLSRTTSAAKLREAQAG